MASRCEVSANQMRGRLEFSENVQGINEWKHSWPKGEISYRLNNFSNDFNKDWQERAVTVALRAWQLRITDLYFRREYSQDPRVDFEVSFEDLAHFDNKKSVFAHAYFPGQGEISGDVHINDSWDWVAGVHLSSLGRPPLVPIMIHEFGHSLGLRHDTRTNEAIMYPSFNLGKKKTTLHQYDIDRIQSRYGARMMPEWIIKYFIERRIRGSDFR